MAKGSPKAVRAVSAPISQIPSIVVARRPVRFGVAPATKMFPEGGISVQFYTKLPFVAINGGTTYPGSTGPFSQGLSAFTASYTGTVGRMVEPSLASLIAGNNSWTNSQSQPVVMFPTGVRNISSSFSHFRVRSLVMNFITQVPTTQAGSMSFAFIHDPTPALSNTTNSAGLNWLSSDYVADLPGSLNLPLWQSGSLVCIDERKAPADPLPIAGGARIDVTLGADPNLTTPPMQYLWRSQTQGMLVGKAESLATVPALVSHVIWAECTIDLYGAELGTFTQPTPQYDPTFLEIKTLRHEMGLEPTTSRAAGERTATSEAKEEKKESFATPRDSPRSRAAAGSSNVDDLVLVSKAEFHRGVAASTPGKPGPVGVDTASKWFGRG